MACRLGPKGGGPKNQLEMVQLAVLEKQSLNFSQEGRKVGRQESSAENLPVFSSSVPAFLRRFKVLLACWLVSS